MQTSQSHPVTVRNIPSKGLPACFPRNLLRINFLIRSFLRRSAKAYCAEAVLALSDVLMQRRAASMSASVAPLLRAYCSAAVAE
jgi:hypothetical protein